MSYVSNALLTLAQIYAQTRGSGLVINITDENISYKFAKKESNEKRIWENHYENCAVYIGNSANPVKLKVEDKANKIDLISTKYYSTFMKQEAIERMFAVQGSKQDIIVKLLYAILAGIAITGLLVMISFA